MVFNRKAISPVVVTALLLVVAVVAVVGFQGWYTTFQSSKLVDVQDQADSATSVTVEAASAAGNVYVRNAGSSNLSVSSVLIDGNECITTNPTTAVGSATTPIPINSSCLTADSAASIFVVHDQGTVNVKLTATQ